MAGVFVGAATVTASRDGHDPIAMAGLVEYPVGSRRHTDRAVEYAQNPPVGGDHAPQWTTCGFYRAAPRTEQAVHSLERGAVWITYRPGLPETQLAPLHRLARLQSELLVSPLDGLPAPLVASAWGVQIRLQSANDSRLGAFLQTYRNGAAAPEADAPCTGGVGAPD